MAQICKHISVDVAAENIFQSIIAKQYDSDSRFLKVRLMNEGEPIEVNPTSIVTINARREDKESKAFAGTVNEDGTVTVPLASWMLELDGQVACDISVIDSEQRRLTSTSFTISVEAAAYDGTEVSDDDNYDILLSLIAECREATDAALKAADGGVYELIETIEVTEPMTIERKNEPDGTPYNFKAITVQIETTAAAWASTRFICTCLSPSVSLTMWDFSFTSNTGTKRAFFKLYQERGWWEASMIDWYNYTGYTTLKVPCSDPRFKDSVSNAPAIQRFFNTNTIPAGTTIKIWGVRA